jgi:hypothetical protein
MILGTFYETIMHRITSKMPDVKHFDMYFGQDLPDEEGKVQPFIRPAVFFEYNPIEWVSLGNKKQAADITFKLRLFADVIQEIAKNQTPAIRNLGHKHLIMLDNMHYHMQGFSGDGFNSISRIGLDPYRPNGIMMGHDMTFKTRLTDTAAMHELVAGAPAEATTISPDA